jgi:hypothetical protein
MGIVAINQCYMCFFASAKLSAKTSRQFKASRSATDNDDVFKLFRLCGCSLSHT